MDLLLLISAFPVLDTYQEPLDQRLIPCSEYTLYATLSQI